MDAPPPDDRDARPLLGSDLPKKTIYYARFLCGGGHVSLTEWRAMSLEDQAALAHAGEILAQGQATLLADAILALASAPSLKDDPLDAAGRSALKAAGA